MAMQYFIENLPEDHHIGYFTENVSELMAKSPLNVIETIVDCNIYFEEQTRLSN